MRPLCLCLMGAVLGILPIGASAQQTQILRDSVYFDVGIPQTENFDDITRTYFETYDADGRALLTISQKQNNMGEWENWRRRTFEYADNDLGKITISYWGPIAEDWQDAIERTFTYDANGNRTSKLVRKAPGPGMGLENLSQWTYEYTVSGNLSNSLYQSWDGSDWQDVSRQQWIYNAQDRIEEQLLQLWNGSEWVDFRRRAWAYDSGMLSSVTAQVWSIADGEWENSERVEYPNDGNNYWTGRRFLGWNPITAEWDNLEKEVYEFGPNFELQYRIFQKWEDDAWQNIYRMYYEVGGGSVSVLGDRWDVDEADWFLHARHQAVTENYERLLVEQGWQFWNEDLQIWENDTLSFRRTHFWSEHSTATEEILLPDPCVIPNPYSPGMEFSCPDLKMGVTYEMEIYALTGQQVFRDRLEGVGPYQINADLPMGLYLVRITDGREEQYVQKIVISR